MDGRASRAAGFVGLLALGALAVWLWLVILAPVERTQGVVQKLFYAHLVCVPPTYLGFILTAIGGIGFLRTRRAVFDRIAVAGAEVGVVFCTLILLIGPLWAKPVWGHWWAWDLRLTLTLVLWFIYVAYLFLRAFAFGSDAARTFASVYGILGTLLIPLVYYAVDLARGRAIHPSDPVRAGLPEGMGLPLLVGLGAFLLVFAYLTIRRFEVAHLEARMLEALGAEERP